MGANVALIFSGQYVKWVSKMRDNLPPGVDPWGLSLKYLMGAVIASGGVMLGTFSFMQRNVMTDPNCVDQEKQAAKKKKTKVKMGLRESAKVRIFFYLILVDIFYYEHLCDSCN
jgi:AAA family ATP:ADP antiporter